MLIQKIKKKFHTKCYFILFSEQLFPDVGLRPVKATAKSDPRPPQPYFECLLPLMDGYNFGTSVNY